MSNKYEKHEKPNAVAYIVAIHPAPAGEGGCVLRRLEMPVEALERYTVRSDAAEIPSIVMSRAEIEFFRWHSDMRGASR